MRNSTLYAIYDTKAEEYVGQILQARHDAVAVRTFSDIASQSQTMISQHPEDFELHALGVMDERNVLSPAHRVVITGAAWKAAQQPTEQERNELKLAREA